MRIFKTQAKEHQNATKRTNSVATFGPLSYRLQIHVEPEWGEIIRRVVGFKSREEQVNALGQLKFQDDRMLHRTYDFTEFFDLASGLTIRFQQTHIDGRTHSRFVKQFCDAGYLFGHNNPLMPENDREKYQIAVSEDSIYTECFDPYIGGLSLSSANSLCSFPIDAVLEFGIALQLRFHDLTLNHVIQLPDKIEAELLKRGVKYENMFDYKPGERNITKEDPEFFKRYGRPKISSIASFSGPYFQSDCCYYSLKLQVFTPETARSGSRLEYSFFTGEHLFEL